MNRQLLGITFGALSGLALSFGGPIVRLLSDGIFPLGFPKSGTVGFDVKNDRIAELESGIDTTLECSSEELSSATNLSYTTDVDVIRDCNFYIVTVPTPIGDSNRPLLTPLKAASAA